MHLLLLAVRKTKIHSKCLNEFKPQLKTNAIKLVSTADGRYQLSEAGEDNA